MASEVLSIPEEHLEEVIRVVRSGLAHEEVSREARERLTEWCDQEEEYLRG